MSIKPRRSLRPHISILLALLLSLATSAAAVAKGSFAFVMVSGDTLKQDILLREPAITEDWFAFADFSQPAVEASSNPGLGYEITRYYIDGRRKEAFDHLHYYPASGFVYFDGLVGGASEYDGKWHKANPSIRAIFEAALQKAATAEAQRHAGFIRRS